MLSKLSANDLQLAVGCTLAKAAELQGEFLKVQ